MLHVLEAKHPRSLSRVRRVGHLTAILSCPPYCVRGEKGQPMRVIVSERQSGRISQHGKRCTEYALARWVSHLSVRLHTKLEAPAWMVGFMRLACPRAYLIAVNSAFLCWLINNSPSPGISTSRSDPRTPEKTHHCSGAECMPLFFWYVMGLNTLAVSGRQLLT